MEFGSKYVYVGNNPEDVEEIEDEYEGINNTKDHHIIIELIFVYLY